MSCVSRTDMGLGPREPKSQNHMRVGLWETTKNSQPSLNVEQYSTNKAYQTAKATMTAGATLRTCVSENLDSKAKKSIRSVTKGDACKARSVVSGRRSSAAPGLDETGRAMRCGKDKRRVQ